MSLYSRLAGAVDPRAEAARFRSGVQRTSELERIAALPRRAPDWGAYPDLTILFGHGSMTLWPLQNAALWEAEAAGGLFAPMGVGCGKTLTCQLLFWALQSTRAVLLVPPQLRDQLDDQRREYGKHFKLPSKEQLHVVAYSELQHPNHADVLERIRPDLIIADEAHHLRYRDSARTRRFWWYMQDNPATKFCALSGSLATRSIKDWAHLAHFALRQGSPVPSRYQELEEWAEALDAGDEPRPPGYLITLCNDHDLATGSPQEIARAGFQRRLRETVGVVASGEEVAPCSLILRAWDPGPLPPELENALAHLEQTWEIGDDELVEVTQVAAKQRQLAQGFYYRWEWPDDEKDYEWLEARSRWARVVRAELARRSRGVDGPAAVARNAERGTLDHSGTQAWQDWCAVSMRPAPPTVPVWIDTFAIEAARRWAQENTGIVWYAQGVVGQALGLPLFTGGMDEELRQEAARADRSIACSIKAHGTGKNLQTYSRMLIMCPPANGGDFQQLLGRLVRPGQKADEVTVDVALYTPALRSAYDQAIEDARFVAQTQGDAQLLLTAMKEGIE